MKAGVVSVVFEHSGITLEGLLYLVEKALDGRKAQSLGVFSDGDSREIHLLQGRPGNWPRRAEQLCKVLSFHTDCCFSSSLVSVGLVLMRKGCQAFGACFY